MNKIYAEGVRGFDQVSDLFKQPMVLEVDVVCDQMALFPNNDLPFFQELLQYYNRGFVLVVGDGGSDT